MTDLSSVGYDFVQSATVNANGNATVTFGNNGPNTYVARQVSIEMANAPSGAIANLRKNGVLITLMVAAADVADSDPPVTVRAGESLTVDWTSCTPGDVGTMFVIYDKVR